MPTLQSSLFRLAGHLLHMALLSQLSVYTIKPAFGSSYLDIYRPLIIPILFTVMLILFLRKKKNTRGSKQIQISTTAFCSVAILVGRSLALEVGEGLGPWYGAFVVDSIITFPVTLGTASAVARIFYASNLKFARTAISSSSSSARLLLIALAVTRLFMIFDGRIVGRLLPLLWRFVFPKTASVASLIQLIALASASVSALLSPPRVATLIAISVSIAIQFSGAMHSIIMPSTDVLASSISTSGYLSVLSIPSQGLRILRSDHSILGGEFVSPPLQIASRLPPDAKWKNEPIFAAFVMQEAVRLVTPIPVGIDGQNNALIIGLGIGTSARAMIEHNVATDVVELDAMVVDFAVNYFDFPLNRARVTICDGRKFMQSMAKTILNDPEQAIEEKLRVYDYIIHDVFTGGAVAPSLFTKEVWLDIKSIMAADGVLAVNFGGDLESSMARAMIRTLVKTFKTDGGACRAFREQVQSDKWTPGSNDFGNLVVFCRKQGGGPLSFRAPVEEDYLGSLVRHQALPLQEEVRLPIYLKDSEEFLSGGKELRTLDDESINRFAKEAANSAAGHWVVMNKVLAWDVWTNW
ncbi:hypothetical protein V1512DRAFT_265959 [Lipomyces arxii]|uniref:uncharacterized protein n=1 Tax=Lipomyces arxii TaxID=56418 RepID=UPI0034CE112B